jgi:IS5 family transposase
MRAGPKHCKSFFGYKNHVNADARHKLIRQYGVTDASVHDSRKFDRLVNQANTSAGVYADSAYSSAETEVKLRARGLRSRIHQRASRGHALSKAQEKANRRKRQGSGARRARVRCLANLPRRSDRTDDRHHASEGQDRPSEPRLQHPPPCDVGAVRCSIKGVVRLKRAQLGRRRIKRSATTPNQEQK